MVHKAIDHRVPAVIRNGVQEKKRSFFVVVGDRQKDVIVQLYHILLNTDIKLNKSVLWAYKKDLLQFSSNRKKREKKIKSDIKRGIRPADTEDPFELFISTQNVRYVYYKETEKILGNTYGMCILQDFEAITPNLLARTVETVEGGGLVILLLKGMNSLKQLYTLSMDVHSRYRTEAHQDAVARFNERFILSLGSCESCLVVDDELNVLPISGGRTVTRLPPPDSELQGKTPEALELQRIKESFTDSPPTGSLIPLARTVDQAKALLTFVDAIAEKTLQSTVTLTAARGRGKSAALGVAIAAAVAHGYSNIFITSPSPENLKTLFEFVFKGFDALNYLDHVDYTIIQSTNREFNKAIVRVNVHRQHRQTIQYIRPQDAYALGQAELLVIDEAAAIPLPLVRKLMGPYLVFMASTINGYEGTGRSLSLKLIQQLRDQSRGASEGVATGETIADRSTGKSYKDATGVGSVGRSLREITLSEPIRYAPGDPVERWLNSLLCLDAQLPKSKLNQQGCPHPSKCELLQINRDTLFSFHKAAEKFLQNMVALYVASHYKNSPNDLQLMSDAPAHQLFALVPSSDLTNGRLPEILCVIQVALEGQISRESVLQGLSRGKRADGDLIPWLVSQQFQDDAFAQLSGARIVRIATNSDYTSMGYGSKALDLLAKFYEGQFVSLSETEVTTEFVMPRITDVDLQESSLLQDNVKVRDDKMMPPLFARLSERHPPRLDYLGVSYGLTKDLHKFWKRSSFAPVYLKQTTNDLTGEHTCVMLRALEGAEVDASYIGAFCRDFQRRFRSLMSYGFRTFSSELVLMVNESAAAGATLDRNTNSNSLTKTDLDEKFSAFDLRRLDSYADQMVEQHVILDMLPEIASLYFEGRYGSAVILNPLQQWILLAIGLQRKTFEDLEKERSIEFSQLRGIFVKIIRKISMHFRALQEGAIANTLPEAPQLEDDDDIASGTKETTSDRFKPLAQTLSSELQDGIVEVQREEKERVRSMIDALPLDRYEIANGSADWEEPERQIRNALADSSKGKSTTVSVRSGKAQNKRKAGEAIEEAHKEAETLRNGKKSKKGSTSMKAR